MATTKKTETSRRTQKTEVPEIVPEPTCTVPDCDRPVYVRGLCEVHWADPKA